MGPKHVPNPPDPRREMFLACVCIHVNKVMFLGCGVPIKLEEKQNLVNIGVSRSFITSNGNS